jgi:hypothetical protein
MAADSSESGYFLGLCRRLRIEAAGQTLEKAHGALRAVICEFLIVFLLAYPSASLAETIITNNSQIVSLCDAESKIIHTNSGVVICIFGEIDSGSLAMLDRVDEPIKYLIIDSAGGSARESMSIGQRLWRDRTNVIVSGQCMSSCANYIIPAAASISTEPGSIIVMHGSIPQDLLGFIRSVRTNDHRDAIDVQSLYIEHRDGIARIEREYFDLIQTSFGYINRYNELVRSAVYAQGRRCASYREFFLILNEDYARAFGIHVSQWSGFSTPDSAFDAVSARFPTKNLLYGVLGVAHESSSPIGYGCV